MEKISRYRILQIVFIVLFFVSIFAIWNLIRTETLTFPQISISDLFNDELAGRPTAVIVTPTSPAIDVTELATAAPQNFTYYEVEEGDTLASIADEFNVTISTIQQANGLESVNVAPDEVLAIPSDGAFSLVGVAATVESISATQVAVISRATAVSATALANEANINFLATREQALLATVDANTVKIDVLAEVEESERNQQGPDLITLLTGPILTSILALGGFLTSTWFEWRDDKRDEDSANALIERKKLEAELRLLNLEVLEKERKLRRQNQENTPPS